MAVRVDLNISLDGVASPADPTPEQPMGADWEALTAAYAATRTFRERVLGDTSGAGTTGVDDAYAAVYFEGVGAEIMGAAVFGLHTFPDDAAWTGWWGDEPPFRVPVFVLTHAPRAAVSMANGTSFEFLSVTPAEALERALAVAGGRDVRIGGGTGGRAGLPARRPRGPLPRRHHPDRARAGRAALGRPKDARERLHRHQPDGRERHHPRHLPALNPDRVSRAHGLAPWAWSPFCHTGARLAAQ